MPQKTRVGNDRSQSATDVARRRNRNEKLYKAGARSSVTLAAQNAGRRAAVSEIELALSTRSGSSRWPKAAIQSPSQAPPAGRPVATIPPGVRRLQLLDSSDYP